MAYCCSARLRQEEYEAAAGVYEVSLEEWEKEKESRKRAAAADAVA